MRPEKRLQALADCIPVVPIIDIHKTDTSLRICLKNGSRVYGMAYVKNGKLVCEFGRKRLSPDAFIKEVDDFIYTEANAMSKITEDIERALGLGRFGRNRNGFEFECSMCKFYGEYAQHIIDLDIKVMGDWLLQIRCTGHEWYMDTEYYMYEFIWMSKFCDCYEALSKLRKYINDRKKMPDFRVLPLPIADAIKKEFPIWPW
jgi:hypothetical protein